MLCRSGPMRSAYEVLLTKFCLSFENPKGVAQVRQGKMPIPRIGWLCVS